MFQFSGFASFRRPGLQPGGLPHSDICGSKVICTPRSFSQLITSFVASESLGIPVRSYLLLRLILPQTVSLFALICSFFSLLILLVNELLKVSLPSLRLCRNKNPGTLLVDIAGVEPI
jgi:hypothetical protein